MRHYTPFDNFIIRFDKLVRPSTQVSISNIEIEPSPSLSETERQKSVALMRINHSGEVCAQALYQAQALIAREPALSETFKEAASEEQQHLDWCAKRIKELKGRTSFLNPIWYLGSFTIGLIAGLMGDKISLGFLAETEHQVVHHLDSHLEKISPNDKQSRVILEQMRKDELAHATKALDKGGIEFPKPISTVMSFASKIMTFTTKYI